MAMCRRDVSPGLTATSSRGDHRHSADCGWPFARWQGSLGGNTMGKYVRFWGMAGMCCLEPRALRSLEGLSCDCSGQDWRGGRCASQNIIPSSTGAAKAGKRQSPLVTSVQSKGWNTTGSGQGHPCCQGQAHRVLWLHARSDASSQSKELCGLVVNNRLKSVLKADSSASSNWGPCLQYGLPHPNS